MTENQLEVRTEQMFDPIFYAFRVKHRPDWLPEDPTGEDQFSNPNYIKLDIFPFLFKKKIERTILTILCVN